VIQVSDNDPAKWGLALNNARNVQQDLGKDNVQIEIVAYGPGLAMLRPSPRSRTASPARSTTTSGMIACENTMTNTKVTARRCTAASPTSRRA
jgi:intracellular sulfur oxidation DsrE/DsrF family protein